MHARIRHTHTTAGFGLVEVLIGTALIATAIASLLGAYGLFLNSGLENARAVQATHLAEEGIEAARAIRDDSWSRFAGLSTGTAYYLHWQNGWRATTTEMHTVPGVTRTMTLQPVWRDDADDIVASSSPDAAYTDDGTRRVDIRVSWDAAGETRTVTTYITNVFQ